MSIKHDNLFDQITSDDNIYKAYKNTQKASLKYKYRSLIFGQHLTRNLKELKESLLSGNYTVGKYTRFTVYEPKERIIDAPDYKDKIVQHMLSNVVGEIYRRCFIYDSYSCIKGKGTHKAVAKINEYIKAGTNKFNEPYIVRTDIRKFFYSIDREILKRLFRKKIKCGEALLLMDKIVDSSPEEKGLPLGCTTSQLFTNIYLNELDNYVKRVLKVRYYVRYSDDAILIVEGKKTAQDTLLKVKNFIEGLNLKLSPEKSMISKIKQGVNMVGFYIHPTHRKLRRCSKKRVKRKLKKMPRLIEKGKMKPQKAEQMLNSWLGHAKHGSTYNFINYLVERFDHLKLSSKETFIIRHNERTKKKTKHRNAARL